MLRTQGLLATESFPQWDQVKIFRKQNGVQCSNGHYSKMKRDIVMGPKAKMVATHRATNAPLTKIWLTKQNKVHQKKVVFCKRIKEKIKNWGYFHTNI